MSAFGYRAQAWLYAYVQTSTPGYRQIKIGATTYTIANTGAAGLVWLDFIQALDTAIAPAGWNAAYDQFGAVQMYGPSLAITWPDRLGGLLGMEAQPGDALGAQTTLTSTVVPYASIPLYGATWDQVDVRRSVQYQADRMGRERGYIYGSARVWTWTLVMNAEALTALRTGWCLRKKIKVIGAGSGLGTTTGPIASDNPGGELEGWPLGIQSVKWRDKLQQVADVTLLVAGGEV